MYIVQGVHAAACLVKIATVDTAVEAKLGKSIIHLFIFSFMYEVCSKSNRNLYLTCSIAINPKTVIVVQVIFKMFYFYVTCTKPAVEELHSLKELHYCLPRPFIMMIKVNYFAVDLTKAGKGFKEIKTYSNRFMEQIH